MLGKLEMKFDLRFKIRVVLVIRIFHKKLVYNNLVLEWLKI